MTAAPEGLTWHLLGRDRAAIEVRTDWAGAGAGSGDGAPDGADWAWGGATGRGVRVCVIDSGVDTEHPLVGPVNASYLVREAAGEDDGGGGSGGSGGTVEWEVVRVSGGDSSGHGTACASIIRGLAPQCDVDSVQVLGSGFRGSGDALIAGIRWAVERGYDVINMSLSTTRRQFAPVLHDLADQAYFGRTLLVASAHNMPVESYPWRFSSVISVGSHDEDDPGLLLYNPSPPVEFFARGVRVPAAWPGGATRRCTGNSFATPHVAGLCARIVGKHRGMTAFQVKQALFLASANVSSH
ncbi:S8 family peptidase [Streptomyces kanamyceticus]|uniref:Serine protease n=1 Tax=Streptomyces kanamyceticus TaxID=1967 RepID=A0A5J6G6X7_STRKN|nr:S8 family serine peptidase [Streptomyces kanamyceticus]QEU90374.1 serine protease [Streptomyces kanamyceticus]